MITGAISNTPDPGEPTGLPDIYIAQGIQRAIAARNMTLMIADTGGRSDKVEGLVRTFMQHKVEGLIYVADYHRCVDFDASGADCPVVLANCYDTKGTPSVLPDDRACQRALVERLIVHGHRRIGFLTRDTAMDAASLRVAGYRDALARAGIAFDPDLLRPGFLEVHQPHNSSILDPRPSILGPALEALLSLDAPPTVICCGNDEMALRLYGLLRTRGIRQPDEISVAGFDNCRAIAETLLPPLTTVEPPYRDMGKRAAEVLPALILTFIVIPFFFAFVLSLTNRRPISLNPTEYVGLKNHRALLGLAVVTVEPERDDNGAVVVDDDAEIVYPRLRTITRSDEYPQYRGMREWDRWQSGDDARIVVASDVVVMKALVNTLLFVVVSLLWR